MLLPVLTQACHLQVMPLLLICQRPVQVFLICPGKPENFLLAGGLQPRVPQSELQPWGGDPLRWYYGKLVS